MNKRITNLLILLCMSAPLFAQLPIAEPSDLMDCDLLFVTSPEPEGNVITDVTEGYDGLPIDHVAIFYNSETGGRVVEAVPDGGVRMVSIERFQEDNHQARIYVARVNQTFDPSQTLRNALSWVGRPYDHLFLADNEAIYCSELVQFSFVDEQGQQIFSPIAMSFHDGSGAITRYWQEFYREHGMEVPEGKPGTNPGEMSRRPNVSVLYRLGAPL